MDGGRDARILWLSARNIGVIALYLSAKIRSEFEWIGRAKCDENKGVRRRVWIRRSTCSATSVSCLDDAVVDELRDLAVLKFANSLTRRFDSPDLVMTITPRVSTRAPSHSE